jgi:DNA-binding MarR family transcriptional regulator
MVRDVKEAREIANELRPVLLRLARELRREIHSLGVTGGQVSVLAEVKHTPGITAAELAERERVSAPAMSNHVARLEAAGLIARVREGDDRRRVGLTLTRQGEKVLRSVRMRRTAWLARRLQLLDDGDRAAVEAAVEPLEKLLKDDE